MKDGNLKNGKGIVDFGSFLTEVFKNEELVSLLGGESLSKADDCRVDELLEGIVSRFYTDEPISTESVKEGLPEPLKKARNFEMSVRNSGMNRAQIFFREAQMLAYYEDDFDYEKNIIRYYPTYQSLNNRELRAYFSWRTKWRKGIKRETCLSYAFIYIYELLHLIGCTDAEDAYSKLVKFSEDYSYFDPYINIYLKGWMRDFVVYYRLNPSLLENTEDVKRDNAISVLLKIHERSDDDIFQAAIDLSGAALKNSRLTKKHLDIMKAVVAGTLRQIATHYAEKCRNSWIEHYFGYCFKNRTWLFERAVFCYQRSDSDYEVELSPIRKYEYVKGQWYCHKFHYISEYRKEFLNLLRTIDSVIRKSIKFDHITQQKVATKWIINAIKEEIQKWNDLKRREEARKREVSFDFSKLGDIRSDSEITREKLLTEEEIDNNFSDQTEITEINAEITREKLLAEEEIDGNSSGQTEITEIKADISARINSGCNPSNDNVGFDLLSPQEKRYLQCLLQGTSVNWINGEGLLTSLLCDSINDKLYSLFEDTVLEDGVIIEDYTEELKKGLYI